MNTTICSYFSTFIPGFGQVIQSTLTKDNIVHIEDGLVLFETKRTPENISSLCFFNNSFSLLSSLLTSQTENENNTVDKLFRKSKLVVLKKYIVDSQIRSLKVIVSKNNQPISIFKSLRREIEDAIQNKLHVKIDNVHPDTELWFLLRQNGTAYCGLRITDVGRKRYQTIRGELRPELAHLLCLISDPQQEDIILDPFAGSGSIIRARSYYSFVKAYCVDNDIAKIDKLKTLFQRNKKVIVLKDNALSLKALKDSSINKIITDPPWGGYANKETDFEEFFDKMLTQFTRVLKKEGMAVILTARKKEFLKTFEKFNNFSLKKEYDVLVSGKKAGVYKINKTK